MSLSRGVLGLDSLLLVGVNHTTAPIAVRERLAIPSHRLADATRSLAGEPGVREAMILSTCNRVELLTVQEPTGASPTGPLGSAIASPLVSPVRFLQRFLEIPTAEVEPHLYQFRETEAVRHLFRVASSLDSMVVGEPQILGQVKQSFAVAREVGAIKATGAFNSILDPLLQRAFSVAKRVRTETQIGANTVSVASVAADLARKIFGTLADKTVLLVGAGKMSDLAARHLIEQGAGTLLVSNRTEARAQTIADSLRTPTITTGVIPFEQLHAQSHRADIIITSTGAGQVFTPDDARASLSRRRNRPVFFIDIAVPRDVSPEVNSLEGCFVYDIDDLQQVAQENRAGRSREAEAAERIVSVEVDRYNGRVAQQPANEAIKQLLAGAESTRQHEVARSLARLAGQPLTPEQGAAIEALTRSLTAKLLHPHIAALRATRIDDQS